MMFGYGAGCWDGGWGIGMLVMMIIWILFVAFVAYGFIHWIRNMAPPWRDGKGRPDEWAKPSRKKALDILEEAYARGEIGRDEFLLKRDDLMEK